MLSMRYYTVAVHDLDAAIAAHEARFGMQRIGERTHNNVGNFDGQAMGYGEQVADLYKGLENEKLFM